MKRYLLIALLGLVGGLQAEVIEKITEYKFICNDKENPVLTDLVNDAILDGWQPVGPAIRGGYTNGSIGVFGKNNETKFNYCQTMVKRKNILIGCPKPTAVPTATPTPLTESLAVTFKDNFFTDVKALKQGPHDQIEVFIHVATKGDTLGGLAKKYYKDGNLWPIIFFDNMGNYVPENSQGYIWGNKLFAPDLLPDGLRVRIRKAPIDSESKESVKEWLKDFNKP